METLSTSSSVTPKQKMLTSADYVAKTPGERLHPVEKFIGKLEEAVKARL